MQKNRLAKKYVFSNYKKIYIFFFITTLPMLVVIALDNDTNPTALLYRLYTDLIPLQRFV